MNLIGFWRDLRSRWLWKRLRGIGWLRSSLYLAIELHRSIAESRTATRKIVDRDFREAVDPWKYETSPVEQSRFLRQTELLDRAREDRKFQAGLEIGCAEGLFTEILAERCDSLAVLDLSPLALARAQRRRDWHSGVRFSAFDLRNDAIGGSFDLIVVAGVLEYFNRRRTFVRIREKLTVALRPGGYLLIETTRANPVVEDAWWAKHLIRGRWINAFFSTHPSLTVVSACSLDNYVITLCRKAGDAR